MLLIKDLQKFDAETFRDELIDNLNYISDQEVAELQFKAEQLKGILKAAIKYKRKQENTIRQKKIEIMVASAIAKSPGNKDNL
jgi:hypothetical protein